MIMKTKTLLMLLFVLMTIQCILSVHAFTWKDPAGREEAHFNCLFDWVESTYPEIFFPPDQQNQYVMAENERIDYRYYEITDTYIAAWLGDFYYIGPDASGKDYELIELGRLNDWYFMSGCQTAQLKLYFQTEQFSITGPANTRWKEIGLPYAAEMVSRLDLTRTDIISHGTFKLEAIGDRFIITDIEVSDILGNTWAMVDGTLGQSGPVVMNPGDRVYFELISGRNGDLPSIIQLSFMAEGMGEVFNLIIHFKSSTYPLQYYKDHPST